MAQSTCFLFVLALLMGIFHVGAESCNHESFFEVDVDIDPKNVDFDFTQCDVKSAKKKLQKLIQKVVTKRFDAYLESRSALYSAEVETFCGGKTDQRRGRELLLTMSQNGWSYSSLSKCRFCLPDNHDVSFNIDPPSMELNNNGTLVQLSVSPSSTPSMAPTSSTSAPSTRTSPFQREETLLQEHLQHQLTRVLTRKINKNSKRSCLVGSQSDVTVTLTPTGSQPPAIVCPVD